MEQVWVAVSLGHDLDEGVSESVEGFDRFRFRRLDEHALVDG
jgi:hypothetical protein